MIFGKDYDRSLLLVLMLDKDNSERIIKFIKDIPQELYVKLKYALKKYQEFVSTDKKLSNGNIKEFSLCGEMIDEKKDLYSFYIRLSDGVLCLSKHVLNENQHYYSEIDVSLYPYFVDDSLDYFDKKSVGEVMLALDKEKFAKTFRMEDYAHIRYEFMKTFYGNVLIVHNNDFLGVKKRVKKINNKKMLDDYSVADLSEMKF